MTSLSSVRSKTLVDQVLVLVCVLALNGVFSSTFTLTIAYLSDTVTRCNNCVVAYGLALATFGLSFTVGPAAGGYLACATTTIIIDVLAAYPTVLQQLFSVPCCSPFLIFCTFTLCFVEPT